MVRRARSVRNALERGRLRHARRLLDRPGVPADRAALTTFEAVDFSGSRVFAGGAAAVAARLGPDGRLAVLPLPGTPLDRPWHLVGGRRASRATTLLVDHVPRRPGWEPSS